MQQGLKKVFAGDVPTFDMLGMSVVSASEASPLRIPRKYFLMILDPAGK
jgi:hypothetical protein